MKSGFTRWNGWWGDDRPFHAAVFVLTHHAREPRPMDGATTYYFVADGIESALAQARAAADDGRCRDPGRRDHQDRLQEPARRTLPDLMADQLVRQPGKGGRQVPAR